MKGEEDLGASGPRLTQLWDHLIGDLLQALPLSGKCLKLQQELLKLLSDDGRGH